MQSIFSKYFSDGSSHLLSLEDIDFSILSELLEQIRITTRLSFEDIVISKSFTNDLKATEALTHTVDKIIMMILKGHRLFDTIIALGNVNSINKFKVAEEDSLSGDIREIGVAFSTVLYYSLFTGKTELSKDDHIPKFLVQDPFKLTVESFVSYKDCLTTAPLKMVLPYVMRSIKFNNLDSIIMNRIKLGTAGMRLVKAFVTGMITMPLSEDEKAFRSNCEKILKAAPCSMLHPVTRCLYDIEMPSLNRVCGSLLVKRSSKVDLESMVRKKVIFTEPDVIGDIEINTGMNMVSKNIDLIIATSLFRK